MTEAEPPRQFASLFLRVLTGSGAITACHATFMARAPRGIRFGPASNGGYDRAMRRWVMCFFVLLAAAIAGCVQVPDAATATPYPPSSYGLFVLVPAAAAIGLTILTRQVIPSLFVGVLVGAFMLAPCQPADAPFATLARPLATVRLAVETYILGAVHESPAENYARIKVLAFTLFVAFMVGVILRNGGTAGMVQVVAGKSRSRRRGGVTAWFAGMVVFFDDYANCMILGPTMRPIFDRLKLSRAKLAYVVNATASPDASLALLGTWIGALLGFIDTGLQPAIQGGNAAFLVGADGNPMTSMQVFLGSLPYRFFPILTLIAALLFVMLDRDFGPMRQSQDRAARGIDNLAASAADDPTSSRPIWWLGFFPVFTLVAVTMIALDATGMAPDGAGTAGTWLDRGASILKNADSYLSILYGSLAAVIVALLLNSLARSCTFQQAMSAGLNSMSHTVPALTILVLAWALSQIEQDLHIGQVLTDRLRAMHFPPGWLPFSISLVAYLLSFATGTSWGTMALLCPITIPLAADLASPLPAREALVIFHASVGSTLGGALFGDHCSPISATTVLASVGADCSQFEHVWTQLPYALLVGCLSLLCGDVLCVAMGQPWYVAWGAAVGLLWLVVRLVGRLSIDRELQLKRADVG